ncbi:MAG TPA: HD domain-containing protein [Stellaceae bacterium]|nr:HD domain-containing protein [Stellaceae bacterium]
MPDARTQRVRDPVHGLIVFEKDGDNARRDQTAWKLLNAPEFQRLRRIRQLGVSEFIFPGATHTRFAHSIGVFHTARKLVEILKQRLPDHDWDRGRADRAVLAALVHDLGHGPFSHAFESVQEARNVRKRHELWTAEIILDPKGHIQPILERYGHGVAEDLANLLTAEVPQDIYHAVVSSSFDADRLDYLRRDRLMTGTGAGAIDFDWLLDNLQIAEISQGGDDDVEAEPVTTFCLHEKALQAAESFLLARYHLFEQVYLHKTTRGIEALIRGLLLEIARAADQGRPESMGLAADDPLVGFFSPGGDTLANYLALDDFGVWATIARVAQRGEGFAAAIAKRLRDRKLYKALDVNAECPVLPGEEPDETEQRRLREIQRIETFLGDRLGTDVFRDRASVSIYGEIGEDEAKRHKMLSIRLRDGTTREITVLSPTIRTLGKPRTLVRYYFPTAGKRNAARSGGGT